MAQPADAGGRDESRRESSAEQACSQHPCCDESWQGGVCERISEERHPPEYDMWAEEGAAEADEKTGDKRLPHKRVFERFDQPHHEGNPFRV